jgi:hypothetical protein
VILGWESISKGKRPALDYVYKMMEENTVKTELEEALGRRNNTAQQFRRKGDWGPGKGKCKERLFGIWAILLSG